MPTLHMLKGLPASGKTTLALEMVARDKCKRVSKDDLRAMLHGGSYSPDSEQFVIEVRNAIVETALRQGFSVVVDDTNLNPIHQEALQSLAEAVGVELHMIEVNTPLEECVRRDAARESSVGEVEIRKMHARYAK